jgi:hypothetical protein
MLDFEWLHLHYVKYARGVIATLLKRTTLVPTENREGNTIAMHFPLRYNNTVKSGESYLFVNQRHRRDSTQSRADKAISIPLRKMLVFFPVNVRRKPADYEGGSALETTRHGRRHGNAAMQRCAYEINSEQLQSDDHREALPTSPRLAVDVDACIRASDNRRTLAIGQGVETRTPLAVPEWLTSVDDLTAFTSSSSTRYIDPSTVKSVLRRRGVECRDHPATNSTFADPDSPLPGIAESARRDAVSMGCAQFGGRIGSSPDAARPASGVGTFGDDGGERPAVADRRVTDCIIGVISTRVTRTAPKDNAKDRSIRDGGGAANDETSVVTVGCWPPRRLPNVGDAKVATATVTASCLKTAPTNDNCSSHKQINSAKMRKRVSFSDRITTVVMISNESQPPASRSSPLRTSTMNTDLSSVYEADECSRAESSPPMSVSCRVWPSGGVHVKRVDSVDVRTSSSSEDDDYDVSQSNIDDEGFVDENGAEGVSSRDVTGRDMIRCGLCQRRWIIPPTAYCVDCSTYLTKLMPAV